MFGFRIWVVIGMHYLTVHSVRVGVGIKDGVGVTVGCQCCSLPFKKLSSKIISGLLKHAASLQKIFSETVTVW